MICYFRTCHFDATDHVYEEVKLESVMETLDIRINHRKRRIRRESEAFTDEEKDPIINTLESDNSEKADEEFQFFESHKESNMNKLHENKANSVTKMNNIRRNILTRLRSLVSI